MVSGQLFIVVHAVDISNRIAADDNSVKLMSIALKPLAQPPFPLERIIEKLEKEETE